MSRLLAPPLIVVGLIPLSASTSSASTLAVCATGPTHYQVVTLPTLGPSIFVRATLQARHSLDLVMYELTDPAELSDAPRVLLAARQQL